MREIIVIDETAGESYKGKLLKDTARAEGFKYFESMNDFLHYVKLRDVNTRKQEW